MYPEGLWPQDYCYMEGHVFRDGGACQRCGYQLRCYACGQFIRMDTADAHHAANHPMPCSEECEGCEKCYSTHPAEEEPCRTA